VIYNTYFFTQQLCHPSQPYLTALIRYPFHPKRRFSATQIAWSLEKCEAILLRLWLHSKHLFDARNVASKLCTHFWMGR